ncbi:hypothetical protein BHM03_00051704, partial [Ensete ventricosum]
ANRQRPARKRLPTAHPQGAATSGQPARGCRQQGRRRRLQGWPPLGRATDGGNAQLHRLRRGSDDDSGARG